MSARRRCGAAKCLLTRRAPPGVPSRVGGWVLAGGVRVGVGEWGIGWGQLSPLPPACFLSLVHQRCLFRPADLCSTTRAFPPSCLAAACIAELDAVSAAVAATQPQQAPKAAAAAKTAASTPPHKWNTLPPALPHKVPEAVCVCGSGWGCSRCMHVLICKPACVPLTPAPAPSLARLQAGGLAGRSVTYGGRSPHQE